jgi:hypothetical protein
MEDFAEEDGIRLERANVEIRAVRAAAEPNRFDHVDLRIELIGPSHEQGSAWSSDSRTLTALPHGCRGNRRTGRGSGRSCLTRCAGGPTFWRLEQ